MKKLLFTLCIAACLFAVSAHAEERAGFREAVPIQDARLENAHRLTDKVITGAEPHDDAAFRALKELGVKTVITVDGATPNIDAANKYGLRYVHLPIGYDGVSAERGKELAKAITELDGPIYLHCHHGKHRGPAAAVVACVIANSLKNDEALAAMKKLGTGENYLGLWASAREAKPANADELKNLKVEFRSVSPIPPLAEGMVKVDEAFDLLGECKAAGWKAPATHPDLDPAHEALKLHEIFFELARTDEHKKRPADYQQWMANVIETTKALESQLRDFTAKKPDVTPKELETTYNAIQNDCKSCHKSYRNTKSK